MEKDGYEYWHSIKGLYRRCSCWRHLLRPIQTASGLGWIADGNGWYPADSTYPHAPNCPHKHK